MKEIATHLACLEQQISNLTLLSYTLQKQVDALRDVLDEMNPAAVGLALVGMMSKLETDDLYQKLRANSSVAEKLKPG